MIRVSKLNQQEFYINPGLIETIEQTPDTVVTLITGKKFIVAESVNELLAILKEYYTMINGIPPQIIVNPEF